MKTSYANGSKNIRAWLFTGTSTSEGLYTESELKNDPTKLEVWEEKNWLHLTKHWGSFFESFTPHRIDTWYEIAWGLRTVAIEKDKEKAIAKFEELAEKLTSTGWQVGKTAGTGKI